MHHIDINKLNYIKMKYNIIFIIIYNIYKSIERLIAFLFFCSFLDISGESTRCYNCKNHSIHQGLISRNYSSAKSSF